MNIDQIGLFLEHQGLSDEAIDDFFEHHGVKGQKWGVRKAKIKQFASEHKKGLKVAGGVAATVALTAGAIYARRLISANSSKKVQVLNAQEFTKQTGRLFDAHKGLQIDRLNEAHRAGRVTTEQAFKIGGLLQRQAKTRTTKSSSRANGPLALSR